MVLPGRDGPWFLVISAALFIYLLLRAAWLPLVHDEATSIFLFVQPDRFLPFHSPWEANNHFLSTFLGIIGYRTFGLELLAVRWGSVAAFVLYAWSLFRLGWISTDRAVRWALWLALLFCPFLFELFGLFRGYGLALAFFTLTLDGLFRLDRRFTLGALAQVLCGIALATCAVLTLLPLWGVVLFLLSRMFTAEWPRSSRRTRIRSFALLVFLGAVPFALATGLAWVMQRLGLFYYGGEGGMLSTTVGSLCRYVLGSDQLAVILSVTVISAGAICFGLYRVWRGEQLRSPLVLVTVLFTAELTGRIALAWIFNVPYPEDRTAVHLVPLVVLLIALCIDHLVAWRPAARWSALCLAVLPLRSITEVNVDHVPLWPEQCVPRHFMERIAQLEHEKGRPLVVSTYALNGLSWPLQWRMFGLGHCDVHTFGHPLPLADIMVVDARFKQQADRYGSVLDHAPGPGLYLMASKETIATRVILDSTLSAVETDQELFTLFRSELLPLRTAGILVEINGALASSEPHLGLALTLLVRDAQGRSIHADQVFASTQRPHWSGEQWACARAVPQLPEASTLEVVLWSRHKDPYSFVPGRLRISILQPDATAH